MCSLVLFNPWIGPYQVLPFRARVDPGAMAIKGCSTFPKAPVSLNLTIRLFSIQSKPQLVLVVGGLHVFRGAVDVFYSPNRLGNIFSDDDDD